MIPIQKLEARAIDLLIAKQITNFSIYIFMGINGTASNNCTYKDNLRGAISANYEAHLKGSRTTIDRTDVLPWQVEICQSACVPDPDALMVRWSRVEGGLASSNCMK